MDVNTDKQHKTSNNKLNFDCNTKVAVGELVYKNIQFYHYVLNMFVHVNNFQAL